MSAIHDRNSIVGYKVLYFGMNHSISFMRRNFSQGKRMENERNEITMRITRNFMNAMMLGSQRTSRRKHRMDSLQTNNSLYPNRFMNTRAINQASKTQTTYQNMKNNAGELQGAALKLTEGGDNSIFAKAKQSGSTVEITKQVQNFVTYYNGMVRSLQSGSSRVDNSYLGMVNAYSTMYQSALKDTGVTRQVDGTLTVDEKTLQQASLEQLQKAWGSNNSFTVKVGQTAAYIQNNAVSNLNSLVDNTYSSLLRSYGNNGNFFNFWL